MLSPPDGVRRIAATILLANAKKAAPLAPVMLQDLMLNERTFALKAVTKEERVISQFDIVKEMGDDALTYILDLLDSTRTAVYTSEGILGGKPRKSKLYALAYAICKNDNKVSDFNAKVTSEMQDDLFSMLIAKAKTNEQRRRVIFAFSTLTIYVPKGAASEAAR